MSKLSKDAFAIMASCPEARRTYGITVDSNVVGQYVFHWAFPLEREKAHREGYDEKNVHGTVTLDLNYPGCPYCGTKNFAFCGQCGNVICYHGEKSIKCPNCGFSGELAPVDSVELKGGQF